MSQSPNPLQQSQRVSAAVVSQPPPDTAALQQISTTAAPPPYSPATKPGNIFVTALYDFDPIESGDLQFRKNDRIEVLKMDGDWWYGRVHGKVGNFPVNYIQKRGEGQ